MIDNVGDAGFEFQIMPEEEIGFFGGNSMGLVEVFKILFADKPGEGSNEQK